jgi:hypothetical protein
MRPSCSLNPGPAVVAAATTGNIPRCLKDWKDEKLSAVTASRIGVIAFGITTTGKW